MILPWAKTPIIESVKFISYLLDNHDITNNYIIVSAIMKMWRLERSWEHLLTVKCCLLASSTELPVPLWRTQVALVTLWLADSTSAVVHGQRRVPVIVTTTWAEKYKGLRMETRIVFSILQLCLICLSLDSRWFFEPDLDYSDDSQLIAAHARLLQSVLKVPLGTRDVAKIPSKDVELEREGKSNGVETETQRFARQSFNLIPFQNLAKNLKFQSPSSTFCKKPEDIL